MSKKQVMVFCKQSDIRWGEVYFQKGQFYRAEFIHDLLFFKGEMGNFIQIENVASNDYFQEFFTLVLAMTSIEEFSKETTEKIYEKI